MSALKPWTQLGDVLILLAPLFLFSLVASALLYVGFVILIPYEGNQVRPQPNRSPAQPAAEAGAAADDGGFGYISSFSYVLLASLFGQVLGLLVKLVGGFSVLQQSPSNTLVGAIGTVLVVVVGVIGSLFAESGRINLRRPIGAIAFLLSFLVSGFYWKLIEKAI